MSKGSDAPKPPDPRVVAEAQTKSNKETAIANAYLNRIDQTSPFGTSSYQVVGTNPDGTPKFSQSTQFSEPIQQQFDNYNNMTIGMGNIGNSQLEGMSSILGSPLDLNTATEEKIVDLQRKRLDPMYQQQEEQLTNRLAQRGIMPGTEAYDREMSRFGQTRNDGYNSMYIDARQQGMQEALTQRQQPLNEFNALRTGTQVGAPQFAGVPTSSQANTDVAGITQNAYNQQLSAWQAEQQSNNAMMGGIFGLGAAGITKWSDRRLKTNVVRVGALASGLPVYEYEYVWGGPREVGVMAQEAREMFPASIIDVAGTLAVNYAEIH